MTLYMTFIRFKTRLVSKYVMPSAFEKIFFGEFFPSTSPPFFPLPFIVISDPQTSSNNPKNSNAKLLALASNDQNNNKIVNIETTQLKNAHVPNCLNDNIQLQQIGGQQQPGLPPKMSNLNTHHTNTILRNKAYSSPAEQQKLPSSERHRELQSSGAHTGVDISTVNSTASPGAKKSPQISPGGNQSVDSGTSSCKIIAGEAVNLTPNYTMTDIGQQNHQQHINNLNPLPQEPYQKPITPAQSHPITSKPTLDLDEPNIDVTKKLREHWYRPNLSRDEAINKLKTAPVGSFVIRDSTSYKGGYGLAIRIEHLTEKIMKGVTKSTDLRAEYVRHYWFGVVFYFL